MDRLASTLRRIAAGRCDAVFELPADTRHGPATVVEGLSVLGWCAYYGDVAALRHLLGRGGDLASLAPDLGLGAAAFHGHWRLVQFLLESGAEVNYRLPDTGETALHAALTKTDRQRYDRVVRVLLDAGADPNAATVPGIATGAFMRDARTRGETPLHRAAAFGTPDTLRLLLDAGAQVEARDAHGDTPLAWASWHLRPDAVLRLLTYGPHRIPAHHRSLRENLLGDPPTGETD